MKLVKNAVTPFFKLNQIGPWSGFLNEVLSILVPLGGVKLPEVKVRDVKKIWAARACSNQVKQQNFFSDLQLWHLAVLQSLELQ